MIIVVKFVTVLCLPMMIQARCSLLTTESLTMKTLSPLINDMRRFGGVIAAFQQQREQPVSLRSCHHHHHHHHRSLSMFPVSTLKTSNKKNLFVSFLSQSRRITTATAAKSPRYVEAIPVPKRPKIRSDVVHMLRFHGRSTGDQSTCKTSSSMTKICAGMALYDTENGQEVWCGGLYHVQDCNYNRDFSEPNHDSLETMVTVPAMYRALTTGLMVALTLNIHSIVIYDTDQITQQIDDPSLEIWKQRVASLQKKFNRVEVWAAIKSLNLDDGGKGGRVENLAEKAWLEECSFDVDMVPVMMDAPPPSSSLSVSSSSEEEKDDNPNDIIDKDNNNYDDDLDIFDNDNPLSSTSVQYIPDEIENIKITNNNNNPLSSTSSIDEHIDEPNNIKINRDQYYLLYFDGGAKGNPGRAGAGMVLYSTPYNDLLSLSNNIGNQILDNDTTFKEIWSGYMYLGDNVTNNEAEYQALVYGLQQCVKLGISRLYVKGDSKLVVNQVTGKYKVRAIHLKSLHQQVKDMISISSSTSSFEEFTIVNVPRNENSRADELANEAMSKGVSSYRTKHIFTSSR